MSEEKWQHLIFERGRMAGLVDKITCSDRVTIDALSAKVDSDSAILIVEKLGWELVTVQTIESDYPDCRRYFMKRKINDS